MAAEVPASLTLQVIHGPKKHDVRLVLPSTEAGDELCVRHLTDAVYKITDIPAESQKLISKGKSLKDPNEGLKKAGLKNGAKVMLIGKKVNLEDDEQTRALKDIENSIEKLDKKLGDLTYELDGIHRGFIESKLREDATRQKQKQMASLAETLMRLIEKLDALTFEESNKGARGKRKTLVNKIQTMLTQIDGLARGIEELKARHEHD